MEAHTARGGQTAEMSSALDEFAENSTASEPRSRRVGIVGPPSTFRLSSSTTGTFESVSWPPTPSSPTQLSPPIPPRSPLRPSVRRESGSSATVLPPDPSTSSDSDMPLLHSRSFGSFSGLLDSQPSTTTARRPPTPNKPLPVTPDPSTSQASTDDDRNDAHDDSSPPSSSSPSLLHTPAIVTKRTHALLELLSSERAYASDLALIRDIHIPLALGQPAPFQAPPVTPPTSSGSSSRTVSTASESSGSSLMSAPPMTREDARIIFNNVTEIAVFADTFTEQLEEALGGVLEGGSGEDHVGALFLATIPTLEPLYRSYITKHPSALEHLSDLPKTPALTSYLVHTQTLATSLSHAWDLPSLLIKPVQRLLKYSLLLCAIIDETPDVHADKANLKLAREKMEEVARGVNEGRRRREVVKEVLTGTSSSPGKKGSDTKAKKKGLNLGVSASVSLGRMKSLRNGPPKAKEGIEANQEAEEVMRLGEELRKCDTFIRTFAKDTVVWAASVHELMEHLRLWALSFGHVIWASHDEKSEAYDEFVRVVSRGLLPFCDELSDVIKEKLLVEMARLVDTTLAPLRLLEAMQTLQPLHYGLLNLNVSKSRPPPQLLEASQSYVALRAQLSSELPQYLELLNKGIVSCVLQWAQWQASFWRGVYEKWAALWDALKVDSEMNAGAAETLRVWWGRFAEVETSILKLNIVRPLEKHASLQLQEKIPPRLEVRAQHFNDNWSETSSTVIVPSVLSALDPLHIPSYTPPSKFVSSPIGADSRNLQELSRRGLERRASTESLRSKKSGKSTKSLKLLPSHSTRYYSHSHILESGDAGYGYEIALAALNPAREKPLYSRTKSMPISPPMPLKKSHSQGRLLDIPDGISGSNSAPQMLVAESDRGRGPSRKPSFRRRLTDSMRPLPTKSNSRHRRSPSLPVVNYVDVSASPSPNKVTFSSASAPTGRRRSTGGSKIPSMYTCRVVHPCEPPAGVQYRELPFFTLTVDDVYDVLQEAGHPSTHPDLPLYVDDGEDCLLLVRDHREGDIGWALASFLLPED